jgi:hypothetical protein
MTLFGITIDLRDEQPEKILSSSWFIEFGNTTDKRDEQSKNAFSSISITEFGNIIDSRDLIYFISITIFFIALTIKVLENYKRK